MLTGEKPGMFGIPKLKGRVIAVQNGNKMEQNANKAAVLLSTYNGEQYIRTQIDSILAQEYNPMELYIWDDCSTDTTPEILRCYEKKYRNIHVYYGEQNLGYPACFYALTDRDDILADYYFFADQDDRWYPEKIRRAIDIMSTHEKGKPLAYYAGYDLCDGDLNRIRTVFPTGSGRGISLRETLYEVCGLEFAMGINRKAYRLLKQNRPRKSAARGTWMSMLYAALGGIVTDAYPVAAYRRHEASVTNGGTSRKSLWKWRAVNFKKRELSEYRCMLQEFREIVGASLTETDNKMLRRFSSSSWFPNALYKVFYPHRLRSRWTDEAALRALFLLGWL